MCYLIDTSKICVNFALEMDCKYEGNLSVRYDGKEVVKFKQLCSCCLVVFTHSSLNDGQYATRQFERSS